MNSRSVTVPNISCGHCVHTIESELGDLPGVVSIKADQQSKRVEISWEPPLSWAEIKDLLTEINYPPEE